MAHPERFELPTKWFEATYSIQLSYGCVLRRTGGAGRQRPALYQTFSKSGEVPMDFCCRLP